MNMANSNATLQVSKKLKDDEFYTTYKCIEKNSNTTLTILRIKPFYVIVVVAKFLYTYFLKSDGKTAVCELRR